MTLLRTLVFAATAGLALAACTTPPASDAAPADTVDAIDTTDTAAPAETAAPPAADAEEMSMSCDAEKGQWAVGQLADEALVAKVKADTGSDRYRVIPPDTAVTMDYREDRVNIETDADNRVIAVRCG